MGGIVPYYFWEVVPGMGCSISPATVKGLGWPVDVSRETSTSEAAVRSVEAAHATGLKTPSGPPIGEPGALGWPTESDGVSNGSSTSSRAGGSTRDRLPKMIQRARAALDIEERPDVSQGGVRVLAVANQKGGVGKTTTASNLAVSLILLGYRVVLVDMDPQGNASTSVGVPHEVGTPGTYDVLINGKSLEDVVVEVADLPGLTVVPATVDLAGAEVELVNEFGRETRLRSVLNDYLGNRATSDVADFVIIDCPPSLGLLTVNALTAVDEVTVPLQCEYYALEGLSQLIGTIGLVQQHLNPGLSVSGILLTMFDARTRLAPQVAQEARDHFPELVMRTVIPRSVRISEAPSHGESVMTYDPESEGARAYLDAARELMNG